MRICACEGAFTLDDITQLERVAASYEFQAKTTRHLEESRDAERIAKHVREIAEKVRALVGA